jgi:hypothetical protein
MTEISSRLLWLFAAIVGALAACEKVEERDPCLQPRTVTLKAGAYRRAGDTGTRVVDTALRFVIFRPIGGATALGFAGSSKWGVPLSPQADSCRYVLQSDTSAGVDLLDTLTFRYSRRTHFLSNACGYTYFFTLDTVVATSNALDSVRLTSTLDVTNEADAEHIRIFYAR